jgi:hypothetical protein
MKRTTKKIFYRKQLADRRRKRRLVLTPRRIPTLFVPFHGLDEDFCARTILPCIASRDECVPLDRRVVFELSHENDFPASVKQRVSIRFAEEVEIALSKLLAFSVADFNCGRSAGYCSCSYYLGTKDEPIKVDVDNAIDAGVKLATCGLEVPSAGTNKFDLLIPVSMAKMILARSRELRVAEPFPMLPKHIRFEVEELGTLMGNNLFIDETITGGSTAYAIQRGAIRWNFSFTYDEYAPRNSTLIMLRYGIFIPYPEHVVKMEVAV